MNRKVLLALPGLMLLLVLLLTCWFVAGAIQEMRAASIVREMGGGFAFYSSIQEDAMDASDNQATFLRCLWDDIYVIDLSGTPFSDDDVPRLQGAPSMRVLGLSQTPLTDASVPELLRLEGLSQLFIQETTISREAEAELQAGLPDTRVYFEYYDPLKDYRDN